MSNQLLGAFLVRQEWDSGDEWYGELRQIQQFNHYEVIGVVARPPGERIKGGETRADLEAEVSEKAVRVRWIDDPMPTTAEVLTTDA